MILLVVCLFVDLVLRYWFGIGWLRRLIVVLLIGGWFEVVWCYINSVVI